MAPAYAGGEPSATGESLRLPTGLAKFLIEGVDNGGIDVACAVCEEFVASGGCTCCDDRQVTVEDVLAACRAHRCEARTARPQLHEFED
jgi:hypothetical protein